MAQALLRDRSLTRPAVARQLGIHVTTLYRHFPKGDPARFRTSAEIRGLPAPQAGAA